MGKVLQFLRRTAAHWTAKNPTLASDEAGLETDTGKLKIGDGRQAWAELGYFTAGGGASTFLHLADTPASFSGKGGYALVVNEGEDAVEFEAPDDPDTFLMLTDTPANFTAAAGKLVVVNDAGDALEFSKTVSAAILTGGITLDKTSGVGIKVDAAAPTFGWRDITAALHARATGAAAPGFVAYNSTTIFQYQYSNGATQEMWIEFHMLHDYVPGSDVFIHAHWSQVEIDTGGPAGVPGDCKWSFDALYSKGHQQQAFPAAVTTVSATQTASGTVRQHMIAEVQLSSSGAIGVNALEVDGIILVRVWRNPADAADTLNKAPFLHFVDLHYQSTNMATKNKAPNFYA